MVPGHRRMMIWLSAVCLVLPCISLVVLLVMTNWATKRLDAAGVRVGLMGANLRNIPRDR